MCENAKRVFCPDIGQSFNKKYIFHHRKSGKRKDGTGKRKSNASNCDDEKENSAEVLQCPEEGCSSAYRHKDSLERHLKEKHHLKEKQKCEQWTTQRVKCAICGGDFYSLWNSVNTSASVLTTGILKDSSVRSPMLFPLCESNQ